MGAACSQRQVFHIKGDVSARKAGEERKQGRCLEAPGTGPQGWLLLSSGGHMRAQTPLPGRGSEERQPRVWLSVSFQGLLMQSRSARPRAW